MKSGVILTLLAIVAITVVLIALGRMLYRRWQNNPYKGLSRKERRELTKREYELELKKREQDERERVQRYIERDDPFNPNSHHWKDLT